ISGWLARDATHAAMTASSFLAGTMAVTEPALVAATKVLLAGGLCASLDIVSWMRRGSFPAEGDCVSIAFDGNAPKNCGLGRGVGCAGSSAPLCDAELPSGRSLDCGQDSAGLPAGNRREARSSERSEGQGGGAEFLCDLVSALRRRNSSPESATEIHRVAKWRHPRSRCRRRPRCLRKISARPRRGFPELPRSLHQRESLSDRPRVRNLYVPGDLHHRPPRQDRPQIHLPPTVR